MKVSKVAIIAGGFSESSICLAKYLGSIGVTVDYYWFSGVKDQGKSFAFEYSKVNQHFLYHKIVNFKDIPEIAKYFKDLPVTFHLLRHSKLYRKIPFLYDFVLKKVTKLLKRQSYDIIDLVGEGHMDVLHKALSGCNIVHSLHEVGSHQDNILSSPLLNLIIKDSTPVLLFSQNTHHRFLALQGASCCKTKVIPFGKFETLLLYNDNTIVKTSLDYSKPTFLFFGFIKPYKGLDILAQSIQILKNHESDFNLIVAGAGNDPNLEYFQSQKNCYVLNRTLSNQELIFLNKKADIVLLPYKSASQTGIASTAFLFGNPIIATRVGALPEVIHQGYNGILIEPNNPQQLAKAMMSLVNNPEEIHCLQKGVLNFGHNDKFDWSVIAKDTFDFFESIA